MPQRTLATATLLVLVVCACNKAQSSFEQERKSVQKALSVGEAVQDPRLRQNGYVSEALWQCEFQGQTGAAMKTFATRIPAGYKLVRESDSELNFARFDGHDSFYLTLSFYSAKRDSTTVMVLLRSLPS